MSDEKAPTLGKLAWKRNGIGWQAPAAGGWLVQAWREGDEWCARASRGAVHKYEAGRDARVAIGRLLRDIGVEVKDG